MVNVARTILDILLDTNLPIQTTFTLDTFDYPSTTKEVKIIAPNLVTLTLDAKNIGGELLKMVDNCLKSWTIRRDSIGKYILENDVDTTNVKVEFKSLRMLLMIKEYQRRKGIIREYILEKPRKGVLKNWGTFYTLLVLVDKVDLPKEIVLNEIAKYLFYPEKRNGKKLML